MPQSPELIDINELSRRLSIPKVSIYQMTMLHQIPFIKIGPRRLRFDYDKVLEHFNAGKI